MEYLVKRDATTYILHKVTSSPQKTQVLLKDSDFPNLPIPNSTYVSQSFSRLLFSLFISSGVFLYFFSKRWSQKFRKIHRKTPVPVSFLIKLQDTFSYRTPALAGSYYTDIIISMFIWRPSNSLFSVLANIGSFCLKLNHPYIWYQRFATL